MKIKTKILTEIEVTHIEMRLPVRYEEEDIPNDFPFRKGDVWKAIVEIDSGKIEGWPTQAQTRKLEMKVCDSGSYRLLCKNGDGYDQVAHIKEDYVPNNAIPGEYGDYVNLEIAGDGTILNWFREPELSAFFKGDDED